MFLTTLMLIAAAFHYSAISRLLRRHYCREDYATFRRAATP